MAGTVVVTEEVGGGLQRVKFAFTTSSSTGAADGATTRAITGVIERAVIVPNTSTTQPTDQWDVTITDEDGVDVLQGYGANLSNAHTTVITGELLGACAHDLLTLGVTNAGNSKTGLVILYVR